MKLSFITVNYNVDQEILKLIKSINKFCDIKDYEIIIIDNSEKLILKNKLNKNSPNIRYIKSKKNLGFGKGCNEGVKIAKGEFVFFINPDTEIIEGKVSDLLSLFTKKVAAVSPLLLDKKRKPYQQGAKILTPVRAIFSLSIFSRLFPRNRIRKSYYLDEGEINDITKVDVLPGTAFIIRRKFFEKIGGFDENFFLYFEEFDLFKRINELGYVCYISNKLKVVHKWGASTKKRNDINKIFQKSRSYYLSKHYGIITGLLTEYLLRIRSQHILMVLILILASFLRFYKLGELMIFLGDQGWFYLSALDLLKNGNIPLLGIPSSVVWLSQGPLATYLIAASLYLGKYHPVSPAVMFAIFDIATIILLYILGRELFNKWIGLISAFLYATSPLVLITARTPYHTSAIPFLMVIWLLLIAYLSKKNNKIFYFLIFLTSGLLIQLELSNAAIIFVLILLFFKKYLVIKKENVLISVMGFAFGILPFILYDLKNGFTQTLGFPIWILNRIRLFFGLTLENDTTIVNTPIAINTIIGQLSAIFSTHYSFLFIIFIIGLLISLIISEKLPYKKNYFIILFSLIVPLFSFLIHSAPGVAYFPILFPTIILAASYLLYFAILKYRLVIILFLLIGNLNSINMVSNDFHITTEEKVRVLPVNNYNYGFSYTLPLELAQFIKEKKNNVNLMGNGVLGLFPASMDNIKYLLKYKGVSLNESGDEIIISDQDYDLLDPDFTNTVYKLKFNEKISY